MISLLHVNSPVGLQGLRHALQSTNLSKTYRNIAAAAAVAKSLQSCPTLCDPIDSSPPGSPIPGILQARTLERVAISFSNASKWKVKVSRSVVFDSQWPHGLQPTRLLRPWDFPGRSTGVGCHCLLLYRNIKLHLIQMTLSYFLTMSGVYFSVFGLSVLTVITLDIKLLSS